MDNRISALYKKSCVECGVSISQEAVVCSQCGVHQLRSTKVADDKVLDEVIAKMCPECGRTYNHSRRFCIEDGAKLDELPA